MPARLPHTEQTLLQQIKTEPLVYKPIVKYQYFKFNQSLQVKHIFTIPRNHTIYEIVVRVLEGFNGSGTFIDFTQQGTDSPIGSLIINVPRILTINLQGIGFSLLDIFTIDTPISYGLRDVDINRPSTRGSGWGLIEYLDLGQVDGFSN